MNPGRELDALVAEKVMGLEKIRLQERGWYMGVHFSATVLVYGENHVPDVYGMAKQVPHYSADIAAAWLVVEKLKTTKDDLKIELSSSSEYPEEWGVSVSWFEFFEGEEQQWGPFYFAGAAPHAICLAALKACGVEIE